MSKNDGVFNVFVTDEVGKPFAGALVAQDNNYNGRLDPGEVSAFTDVNGAVVFANQPTDNRSIATRLMPGPGYEVVAPKEGYSRKLWDGAKIKQTFVVRRVPVAAPDPVTSPVLTGGGIAHKCLIGGIASGSMPRPDSVAYFARLGYAFNRDFLEATDAPNLASPPAYRAAGMGTLCTWTHPDADPHLAGLRLYAATLDPTTDGLAFVNEWNRPEYLKSTNRMKAFAFAQACAPVAAEFHLPCGGPSTTGGSGAWAKQTIDDWNAGLYKGLAAACFDVYPDYEGVPSANKARAFAYFDALAVIFGTIKAATGLQIWLPEIGLMNCAPAQAAEVWAYAVKVLSPVVDRMAYFIVADSFRADGTSKYGAFAYAYNPQTKAERPEMVAAIRAANGVVASK